MNQTLISIGPMNSAMPLLVECLVVQLWSKKIPFRGGAQIASSDFVYG